MSQNTSFFDGRAVLHPGDCREVLKALADNSIDSVVTDPPYALVSISKRFSTTSINGLGTNETRARAGADPYARGNRGFMGKQWDTGETAFAVEFWEQVLRVLKPGGHVVAFGGTRSYHRLACAIEDAGFEIRDGISYLHASGPLLWTYGTGFPKSHNISKTLDAKKERCSCPTHLRNMRSHMDSDDPLSGRPQQDVRAGLRSGQNRTVEFRAESDTVNPLRDLRSDGSSTAFDPQKERSDILQPVLQKQDVRGEIASVLSQRLGQEEAGEWFGRPGEPILEGRRDLPQETRELREREIRPLPTGVHDDGAGGRLRDGASPRDGEMDRTPADADRVRPSQGPSTSQQSQIEFGALAGQPEPQKRGTWDHCERCGKPIIPDGFGTALKPAVEIICLARKPLSEPTVAKNVMRWGTGALNIDGCRIETNDAALAREGEETQDARYTEEGATDFAAKPGARRGRPLRVARRNEQSDEDRNAYSKGLAGSQAVGKTTLGRWPANLCHDGSPEVLAGFPHTASGTGAVKKATGDGWQGSAYGKESRAPGTPNIEYGDAGNAARFFYSAKADADDRIGSKHPTVKPVDLMRWLVRLITPPGGVVLDPFAGTGTTGEAALRENFRAVMVEREAEYQADIARRMAHVFAPERERKATIAKAKNKPEHAGPLFD